MKLQAAQRQQLQQAVQQRQVINTKVMQFQIMSPHVQDTRESYRNESMETAEVRPQRLKRQPASTMEELEGGDQDDTDEDVKTLEAV